MRLNKYHSIPYEVDGIKFASKREAGRYKYLKDLEQRGEIKNLQLQVPYELIPLQKLVTPRVVKGKTQKSERAVKYLADFVYEYNGKTIVEDTKGMKTPEYVIKRKLLKYRYDLEIVEV